MSRVVIRLAVDVRYSLLLFFRSRQAVFFSFVFPALFLLAIGYLLGGPGNEDSIGFLLPGILGMCIMFSALNGTVGSIVKYRANGVFGKIATTPLASLELNVSRIITGMAIVALSAAVSVLVAWLVFGVAPAINAVSLLVVIAGSVTAVSLGMVVAYIVEDPDSVNAIVYVIVIPLILLSGSLFPVERLPGPLRFVSILSPLTYLNDGLRNAMFGSRYGDALVDTALSCFLCFMLFCIGVVVLMGKEE